MYERYQYLQKHSILEDYIHALKTNLFHTVFNAWMAALTVMTLVLLTGCFGIKKIDLDEAIFHIAITPTIIATIVAVIDIILVIAIADKKVYDMVHTYFRTNDYYKCTNELKKYFNVFCLMGCISYSIASIISVLVVERYYLYEYITDTKKFFFSVLIMVTLFGVVWNIATAFRLHRIDFKKLLCKKNSNTKDKEKQLRFLCYQLAVEIFGCLLTFLSILVYSHNIKYSNSNSTYYSLFYVACFTLMSFYMRKTYQWELSGKNKHQTIYPTKDIFN